MSGFKKHLCAPIGLNEYFVKRAPIGKKPVTRFRAFQSLKDQETTVDGIASSKLIF